MVPRLIEQGVVDDDRLVNQLTLEDWIKIADTFDAWPFRPTVRVSPSSLVLLGTCD